MINKIPNNFSWSREINLNTSCELCIYEMGFHSYIVKKYHLVIVTFLFIESLNDSKPRDFQCVKKYTKRMYIQLVRSVQKN